MPAVQNELEEIAAVILVVPADVSIPDKRLPQKRRSLSLPLSARRKILAVRIQFAPRVPPSTWGRLCMMR
jgi:hypothetical protein